MEGDDQCWFLSAIIAREPIETNVRRAPNPGDLAVVVSTGRDMVATEETVADGVVMTGTGVPGVIVGIVVGTAVLCGVGERDKGICTVFP